MLFGHKKVGNKIEFSYWAPRVDKMSIITLDGTKIELDRKERDIFRGETDFKAGTKYLIEINGKEKIPDPFSRFQPDGVHGHSEVIELEERFSERNVKKDDMIIYEIHVGTFTEKGNFDGVIEKLDYIKEVGINVIEIMPLGQFPGNRGWGYDGTFLFAVQNSYGGPYSFRRLVDEAHKRDISVLLDVIYNHVGPEGNYLEKLGPYFSSVYRSPWGLSFNLDGNGSDMVRKMILSNIEYWIRYFDVDGFRLDAVHAIFDMSPVNILEEIADKAHQMGRIVVAESDLNDPKIIRGKNQCGYGIDAQWNDDFHHAVHSYVTREKDGYYQDFGKIDHIIKSLKDVFVYDGVYSSFRNKIFGAKVGDIDGCHFVVYIQNHDQVGNRGNGERISVLINREKNVAMAALYILSPYIPMLFMGEEYGETNPFLYFSDFSDPSIIQGVREGRRKDNGQSTDPQAESTFLSCKLSWKIDDELLNAYKTLISIRRNFIQNKCDREVKVKYGDGWVQFQRDNVKSTLNFFSGELKVKKEGKVLFKYGEIQENKEEYTMRETSTLIEMVARPGFEPGTSGL